MGWIRRPESEWSCKMKFVTTEEMQKDMVEVTCPTKSMKVVTYVKSVACSEISRVMKLNSIC
jgi:hypothetical protein